VLRSVPLSWPVSDTDLEDLEWFLEVRAPEAAEQMIIDPVSEPAAD
jgi:hypothetical protein